MLAHSTNNPKQRSKGPIPLLYTTEQILGLAPNQVHIRSSRSLASVEKWTTLAHNQEAVWGEFPLKNKPPARVSIRLSHLALHCTCTTRTYPCTHTLALLLLFTLESDAFAQQQAPDWLHVWPDSPSGELSTVAENARANQDTRTAKQLTFLEKRQADIHSGLQELKLWLHDLVQTGLGAARDRPQTYWSQMADRLIDAHATEVAYDVQRLATIVGKGPTWPQEILFIIGRLYLLIQGFERFDSFSVEEQADLRAATGWLPRVNWTFDQEPEPQQEAKDAEQTVRDCWYVVGRHDERVGKRKRQLIWLWGNTCNRFALLSHILYRREDFDVRLLGGSVLDVTLNFYPSKTPFRAQLLTLHNILHAQPLLDNRFDDRCMSSSSTADERACQMSLIGNPSIDAVMRQYAESIALNPWLRAYPVALSSVTARRDNIKPGQVNWSIQDRAGFLLPLPEKYDHGWQIAALGYQDNLSLFGEWNGQHLVPLTVWNKTRFIELQVLQGIK